MVSDLANGIIIYSHLEIISPNAFFATSLSSKMKKAFWAQRKIIHSSLPLFQIAFSDPKPFIIILSLSLSLSLSHEAKNIRRRHSIQDAKTDCVNGKRKWWPVRPDGLKIFATNILTKEAQIFGDFWATSENGTFKQKLLWEFLEKLSLPSQLRSALIIIYGS